MGQSIKQRHAQFLGSSYDLQLDDNNIGNYQVVKLEAVTDALYYLAAKYVEFATDNLEKADRVASGALSSSIVALPMEILGSVYSVSIKLDDYYKFVDKGVKGWADEKGGNSPYQFKNYQGGGKKSSKMVTAIRKWLVSQSLQGTAVNAKKSIYKREKKNASVTDTSTQLAIIISRSIKKKGLKPSHFWSDAEKSVMQIAEAEFAQAIKVDIINSIYGNSNK
jgi:hypothetical protein